MNLKNLFGLSVFVFLLLITACQDDIEPIADAQHQITSISVKKRICLANEHTQELLKDPAYQQRRESMLRAFEKYNVQTVFKANCTAPVIVPVAIHFQGVNNPDPACLQSLAIDQINRLNLDYTGENSDISTWNNQAAAQFSGIANGEMCVKFVIANQNHPSGYGLSNGDMAITINRTQGDQENNWAGYINIFVQPNTGYLGYAPLGGSGNGDGVVIDASAFGSGQGCGSVVPESPFDLGRTLTHEMGHYLLLEHIWGDGCGVDDEVGDTPDQASDYAGCPSIGASSCGSIDMHMNYMDYTDDACMYMFSEGQENRMNSFLLSNLGSVTSNASTVYSGDVGGGTGTVCNAPTTITISGINESSAQVSWSSTSGAIDYNIRYRATGTATFDNATAATNSVTLSGLQSATLYEVSVQTSCGSSNSSYSVNQTFTTTGDSGGGSGGSNTCETPSTSSVAVRNESSVIVDWDDVTDAIRYQIRYRADGSSSWTQKNASNSTKTLNNLLAQTYEYQLRTRCIEGWTSWSQSSSFDLSTGGEPTQNSLRVIITLDDYGSETSWELYDELNNLMKYGGPYQDGINGVKKTVNLDLEDGCYEIDLYDAFGDGICCDYGNGSFEIVDGNNQRLAYSDGRFGTYELIGFCVSNGSARIIKRERDSKKLARGKKK